MVHTIVKRADGTLELRTDAQISDGETIIDGASEEGIAFLEAEVARREREERAAQLMSRIPHAAPPVRRAITQAPQGRADDTSSDSWTPDREKHAAHDGFREYNRAESARAGMGMEVFTKMTDGEARGGTRDFAEFIRRVTFEPEYRAERNRAARILQPHMFEGSGSVHAADMTTDGIQTRTLAEGTGSAGGFLVPPQFVQELLDIARANASAFAAGVVMRSTTSNLVNLPTLATASVASWVAENGAISPTDQAFGQQVVSVSKIAAGTKISNEMIADSDPAVMEVVMGDLGKVIGLLLDLGIFEGTGTSPQIRGYKNASPAVTAGPTLGANGSTPTLDNLMDALYNLYAVNIMDEDKWAWVFHPRVLNTLRKIKDTTNNYILSSGNGVNSPISRPSLLGIPYYMSQQLNIAETVGTSVDCTRIYGGRFYESMVFANGGMVMDTTQESADATNSAFWSDQTWIRAKTRVGFLIRRPAGVVMISGVRP